MPDLKRGLFLLAMAPALVTPMLEIGLNRSADRSDPAALLAGLFVLTVFGCIGWGFFRPTWRQMGIRGGQMRHYAIATAYVIAVIASCTLIAILSGDVASEPVDVRATAKTFSLILTTTFVVVFLTEEGFFRGVLWGGCETRKLESKWTFGLTAFAFASWHIYLPFVEPEFAMAAWQVPIYLSNVLLLSLCWGWIRWATGSVIVCCFVHALWNALVYTLFGTGISEGDVFGVQAVWIYGPERGLLGIAFNVLALFALTRLLPVDEIRKPPTVATLSND